MCGCCDVSDPEEQSALLSQNHLARSLEKLHRGNNTFICGGRVIIGPNYIFLSVTILLLVVPFVAFCVFVAPFFHFFVIFLSLFLYAPVVIFFMYAALSDPGIIPASPLPNKPEDPNPPDPTRTAEQLQRDHTRYTYCETCNIWRPPRSKHCRFCDVCIEKYDHHCPWIGTCVGLRNYRFFVGFLFALSVLTAFTTTLSLIKLIVEANARSNETEPWILSFMQASRESVLTLLVFLVGLLTFLSVLSLSIYHCTLISRGETTAEEIKRVFENTPNKYDLGCEKNCAIAFCEPVPPSRLDLSVVWQQHAPV